MFDMMQAFINNTSKTNVVRAGGGGEKIENC